MDIKKINIGDLFNVNDSNYPYIMEVIEISKHESEHYWVTFKDRNSLKEGCMVDSTSDLIVPIKLTEQILTDNGYCKIWKDLPIFTNYKCPVIYQEGTSFCLYLSGFYKNPIYIDSVHEFQHILRMCGFDEMADNIKVS